MASKAFFDPLVLLRVAPVLTSTMAMRFSHDQWLFLENFLVPAHREKANDIVPSYFKTFFMKGIWEIGVLYTLTTATGISNIYSRPGGAWKWYAAGTALAFSHMAFVPFVMYKVKGLFDDEPKGQGNKFLPFNETNISPLLNTSDMYLTNINTCFEPPSPVLKPRIMGGQTWTDEPDKGATTHKVGKRVVRGSQQPSKRSSSIWEAYVARRSLSSSPLISPTPNSHLRLILITIAIPYPPTLERYSRIPNMQLLLAGFALVALAASAVINRRFEGPYLISITGKTNSSIKGYVKACDAGAAQHGLCYDEPPQAPEKSPYHQFLYSAPRNKDLMSGFLLYGLPVTGPDGDDSFHSAVQMEQGLGSNVNRAVIPIGLDKPTNFFVDENDPEGKIYITGLIDDRHWNQTEPERYGEFYNAANFHLCWQWIGFHWYYSVA
ncbi:hypothetical protein O1611_g6679 [Lasiodiplodia mahajangana]|uniref:Uncharacterized protein n=1 Tax=Lasiodiplodia mahajangana TaxID=1108764 RepID=A0ACC2JHW8_9PEZI|nr:hypothetical protein O1611_g6679 [Lasiodiplodia mahajangana]